MACSAQPPVGAGTGQGAYRHRPADRHNRQTAQLAIEFWAADWSPWLALKTLRRTWPGLNLSLRPHYDDGADG